MGEMTSVVEYVVKPSERRQQFPNGPLALWRPRAVGRGREGLLCLVSACHGQECLDPHLFMSVLFVPGSLHGVIRNDRDYSMKFRSGSRPWEPGQWYRLEVDLLTGEVRARSDADKVGETVEEGGAGPAGAGTLEEALAWLRDELDGALLEALWDEWLAAKHWKRGGDGWKSVDWRWWEPGDMVPAGELLPGDRQDAYLLDGKTWLLVDYHCVNPRCDCQDVMFQVEQLEQRELTGGGGTLRVVLPEERVTEWRPKAATRDQLERLWAANQRRHGGSGRLATRAAHARARGLELHRMRTKPREPATTPAQGVKVGRNERCPCGSGKKYKQCCGRNG